MVSHNEQSEQPVLPAPTPGMQGNGSAPQESQQPGAAMPASANPQPQADNTVSAQDTDIIEPAWVARVEDAFSTHAQDPRALARQLSAVKAEYIAQRYGTTLKQGSEQE